MNHDHDLDYDRALRNAGQDPEQPGVEFYPVTTAYTEGASLVGIQSTPLEFYHYVLSTWNPIMPAMPSDQYSAAVIEGTWYSHFQPEYKAYPAIIAALAATKIEIGCEHLRMPFPAFAVRLPVGFMQEEGGPPIRCLFVAMLRNIRKRIARPVTSIDSEPAQNALTIPFSIGRNEAGPEGIPDNVLMIQAKYVDRDGDDAFANFTLTLERGQTLEERFSEWLAHSKTREAYIREKILRSGGYFPSDKMARELVALAVGTSFFATGRHKAARPILQQDKRPRHERRRFERDHGQEQPTFSVGRDLVLPRDPGAPSSERGAAGEGTGRALRWAHYRTGHLRYQPHGPGLSDRKLIFIEPTLVRPDLPIGGRVTPGGIAGGRPTRDITEPPPGEA